jgi:hypothetical protein
MKTEILQKANELDSIISDLKETIEAVEKCVEIDKDLPPADEKHEPKFIVGHEMFTKGVKGHDYFPQRFVEFSKYIGDEKYISICEKARLSILAELKKALKHAEEQFETL